MSENIFMANKKEENLCENCGHDIKSHIYRKYLQKYKCLFKECYCEKFKLKSNHNPQGSKVTIKEAEPVDDEMVEGFWNDEPSSDEEIARLHKKSLNASYIAYGEFKRLVEKARQLERKRIKDLINAQIQEKSYSSAIRDILEELENGD